MPLFKLDEKKKSFIELTKGSFKSVSSFQLTSEDDLVECCEGGVMISMDRCIAR